MMHSLADNFRLLLLAAVMACPGALPASVCGSGIFEQAVNTLTLSAQAPIAGEPAITLGQVARIDGPDAQAMAAVRLRPAGNRISQADLIGALAEAGFHRGRVRVRGHLVCRLEKAEDRPTPAPWTATSDDPAAPSDLGPTLREKVIAVAAQLAGAQVDQVHVRFAASDIPWLEKRWTGERLDLEPLSTTGLGRVPLIVRRYQGDHLLETRRLTVEVSRRRQALVLTRSLSKGAVITAQDLMVREIHQGGTGEPLTDPSQALGQATRGLLREGSVLLAEHLQPAATVRRGQLITARSLAGSLAVATTVRVLEDGAAGDLVAVRHEKSRQTFTVRVTPDGQGVLLGGDEPSSGREKKP